VGLGVAWLDVPLGVACLLAGLYHLGLALGRRAPAVPATAYAAMGFGMAAMFVPAADPVPRAVWVAAFAASAVWFGIGLVRSGSGAAGHHLVGALAMLFMLLVPGHGVGWGLLGSAVALALAAWFLADIVRLQARPTPLPFAAAATAAAMGASDGSLPATVPEPVRGLPVACLVMNAVMALMLVVMA
jgi:hypothetical protein